MKLPHAAPLNPLNVTKHAEVKADQRHVPEEMRKAAEGLEAVFTQEMMKAMRGTVETSEFSLRNNASDIYQSMLDSEYADVSAKAKSLGLSEQIIDYWLRSQQQPKYNDNRAKPRTGGTNEGQSSE